MDRAVNGSAVHRVPVIDRMAEILLLLERRPQGATIRDLVDLLGLPRTTVYRILNTLQFHGIVRRSPSGSYSLGPRLLSLAASALPEPAVHGLPAIAQPHLERLSGATGEGCKVSIVDDGHLLVICAAAGQQEYALTVIPGQRMPLHAGAAGKTLLAYLPNAEVKALLDADLIRYTPNTLVNRRKLLVELARVRQQGWAEDHGEYVPSIHAFAAPIMDPAGKVVAALSVPFLAGSSRPHSKLIKAAVIAAATQIGSDIPSPRER